MRTKIASTTILMRMIYIIFLFLICGIWSNAQEISSVVHFEEKDGLAERIVEKVTRNNKGYFYFFMRNQVQKYDGKRFESVDTPSSYLDNSRTIQTLTKLEDGQIVVLQNNKASTSFTLVNNKILPLIQSPLTESIDNMDSVFFIGNENDIFSLQELGDNNFAVTDIQTKQVLLDKLFLEKIPNKLFFDKKNQYLYTEETNGDIHAIAIKTGERTKLANGHLLFRNGDLLHCTSNSLQNLSQRTAPPIPYQGEGLRCLWAKADDHGNILIALYTNVAKIAKLYLITEQNKLVAYHSVLKIIENIQDVYADNFLTTMMIASYNGIYVIEFQNKGIENIFVKKGVNRSEFGFVISGVQYNSSDKKVYFTRETEGLYSYDLEKNTELLVADDHYKNNNYLTIDQASQNLYSSSYNYDGTSTLNIWDIEQSSYQNIGFPYIINGIYPLENGHLWLFGAIVRKDFLREEGEGMITSLDPTLLQSTPVHLPPKLMHNPIKAIYQDVEKGRFWIGSTQGLYCVNSSFELIKDFSNSELDSEQKLGNAEIRLIKLIDDLLFIGTRRNGLFILDPSDNSIHSHLSETTGLTDDAIISAEKDSEQNIWLGTFNGLTVLDSTFQIIDRFFDNAGISSSEFNTQASCKDDQNHLYFGSINGITRISPKKALSNRSFQPVIIGDVVLFKDGAISTKSQFGKQVDIPASTDSVKIEYHFPSYYQHDFYPNMDQVDVKISPDRAFSLSDRNIAITDLSAGLLNMEVSNSSNDSSQTLKLNIVRNYIPWLMGLIAAMLIISLWYLFTSIKQKSNRQLEQEKASYTKRLTELELTALRAQMNPHFIFNALGAIQYFIHTKDIEKADEYLAKFAKLMRSILESSKSKFINLSDEIQMLRLYTSLEHIRFEEKFDYEISVDPHLELSEIQVPSMIIQPFVENAINHGLYHLKDRPGKLKIDFAEPEDDLVVCTISDNGIGREASAKIKRATKHTSRGMQIVDERIHALRTGGIYDIEMKIEDIDNEEKGTIVIIAILRK